MKTFINHLILKSLNNIFLLVFFVSVFWLNLLSARDQISIIGSSTVYPFLTIVAEKFTQKYGIPTPIIESTGTGGGFAIFCRGVGFEYPDINNASRPIKRSEIANCLKNGVSNPLEIKIGYDSIVLIKPLSLTSLNLTIAEIYLALGYKIPNKNGNLVKNYNNTWKDINPKLPNIPIRVLGPPTTSGTRDAFIELAIEKGCNEVLSKYPKLSKNACYRIRYDGHWIDAGENDILAVKKVEASDDTLAITGYTYYEQNSSKVAAVAVNNIYPTPKNVINGIYPIVRPLFLYVKKEHLNEIDGLKLFIKEVISKETISPNGYLAKKGLVTLSKKEYKKMFSSIIQNLN